MTQFWACYREPESIPLPKVKAVQMSLLSPGPARELARLCLPQTVGRSLLLPYAKYSALATIIDGPRQIPLAIQSKTWRLEIKGPERVSG
jgi:hypothetical protein